MNCPALIPVKLNWGNAILLLFARRDPDTIMKDVTLSVGVPAYNQGKYLEETIRSILAQKVAPFEIVVSNNHSTDDTEQVLNKYRELIRVIKPDRHLPVHEHLNFIASNLKGTWFSMLSSDDMFLPNFTEVALDCIEKSPEGTVLFRGNVQTVSEEGVPTGFVKLRFMRSIADPRLAFAEQLLTPCVSFACFAVKKASFEEAGGFPVNISHMSDWGLWLKLSKQGCFVFEPQVLSKYRKQYREYPWEITARMLDDEVYLRNVLMPEINKELLVSDSLLLLANKCGFYFRLLALERQVDVRNEERVRTVREKLLPWAARIKKEQLLSRFGRNNRFLLYCLFTFYRIIIIFRILCRPIINI